MNYEFPLIKSIDDVLPAIKDKSEFIVVDKQDYIVINYMVTMPETFEDPLEKGISSEESLYRKLRRECRGITFAPSGKLLSRKYHKFFNVNEKPETQLNAIDLSQSHSVLVKADGSMITPLVLNGKVFFTTKMGITDVAANAQKFADEHQEYIKFSLFCHENQLTPIFEWCSNKNRIVLNYSVDKLFLTGIRDDYTGRYLNNLNEIGEKYNIPVIAHYNEEISEQEGLTRFIDSVRGQTGIEGYVIRFENGHMIKIKTDEYCLFHRSKEVSATEHLIIQAIISEKVDDLKGLLFKEDLEKVIEIEKWFWNSIQNQEYKYLELQTIAYKLSSGDKKKFALEISKQFDPSDVGIIFQLFDGKDVRKILLDRAKKNSMRMKQYDEFKAKHMI